MNIKSVHFYQLKIPFKAVFKHSSASRNTTESIWVEVEGDSGLTGFGESCPRSYVTGETLITARKYFKAIKDRLIKDVHDIDDLKQWVTAEKTVIDQNPAAWCAIELAVLDLFAKTDGKSVEAMLGLPAVNGGFYYSAVLGDSEIQAYKAQLEKYLALGFKDYKIKVSGNLDLDKEKLACFKNNDNLAYRVRLDANNLWRDPKEVIDYIQALNFPVWAIEEPITAGDFKGLSTIAKRLEINIILDESFLKMDDFDQLKDKPGYWIINLRISKMGGLIRSKDIVDIANKTGIGLIIGAQVGETSLLTRAALSIAQRIKMNLLAQEGAFGTYLLDNDIVDSPLMFGEAGKLDVDKFALNMKPGFGLSFSSIEEYLKEL